MALKVLPTQTPSPLARLVEDYLKSCRARGLSSRTDEFELAAPPPSVPPVSGERSAIGACTLG